MDVLDGALNIGLPMLGAFVVPGPVGGAIGGFVGGALAAGITGLRHGQSGDELLIKTLAGGAAGGCGGFIGGRGTHLFGKTFEELSYGDITVEAGNRIAAALDFAKPAIAQSVLAGAAGGAGRKVVEVIENRPECLYAKDCLDLYVRMPHGLAPEVQDLYRRLPDFFCRAWRSMGYRQPGKRTRESPLPTDSPPLEVPEGRSNIPEYEKTRIAINGSVAEMYNTEKRLSGFVAMTEKNSLEGQRKLDKVIGTLNKQAETPPDTANINPFLLDAIDKAVHNTEVALEVTLKAQKETAAKVPR